MTAVRGAEKTLKPRESEHTPHGRWTCWCVSVFKHNVMLLLLFVTTILKAINEFHLKLSIKSKQIQLLQFFLFVFVLFFSLEHFVWKIMFSFQVMVNEDTL